MSPLKKFLPLGCINVVYSDGWILRTDCTGDAEISLSVNTVTIATLLQIKNTQSGRGVRAGKGREALFIKAARNLIKCNKNTTTATSIVPGALFAAMPATRWAKEGFSPGYCAL